ncbi:rRNA maturation RNase YbeY [Candidatus Dojkabacteria bacterium]|nr:rRNA maturation RNase YbeY [Candidatus Dojkabacteria bacterium]
MTLIPTKYQKLNISVVFVDSDEIERLNREYRDSKGPTDVLSFNIDEEINEVYVCPGFIYQSYRGKNFQEEILRMVVHGILHIYGHDHKGKFVTLTKDSEDMFKIQEKILNSIL